jgi:hypothetical protein
MMHLGLSACEDVTDAASIRVFAGATALAVAVAVVVVVVAVVAFFLYVRVLGGSRLVLMASVLKNGSCQGSIFSFLD